MGKWTARLAQKTNTPTAQGTDRTDKSRVSSVLAVPCGEGDRVFPLAGEAVGRPAPELPHSVAVAWGDGDVARYQERLARMLRWGWPIAEAERQADRLVNRDRESDERVSCTDCKHYKPGRCGNHRHAGLNVADVGRDLATLLQHCPGHQPLR